MRSIGIAVVALGLGLLFSSCKQGTEVGTEGPQYWGQRLAESEKILHRHDLSDDERGEALIDIARAYSALRDTDKAMGVWSAILWRDDVSAYAKARAQYSIAAAAEAADQWRDAVAGYEKYSSMYDALPERQQLRFDQNRENGDLMMCHAGQICELQLHDPKRAERHYQASIRKSKAKGGYSVDHLTELLGDFYCRQKEYDKAIAEYEAVSSSMLKNESERASPASRPVYKIIESLVLAGRKAEAKQRYRKFMEKWGSTDYPLDQDYVQKARTLMKTPLGTDP